MELTVTRLRVDEIGEEVSVTTLRPDEAWLEGLGLGAEVRAGQSLAIDLEFHRVGEEVFVSGRLGGTLELPCSRCLEPAHVAIDQPFGAVYLPAPAATRGAGARDGQEIEPGAPSEELGQAMEPESTDVFYHVRGWLDLTPMLREQILLMIPPRALCGEECRGLCPTCGANQNRSPCACPARTGMSKFEKLRGLFPE